jgi:YHS domain-containing protein
MRWVLILAIAVFLIAALAKRVRSWTQGLPPSRQTQRDELVKDPVCQTYVVMSRAIRRTSDGGTVHFCSRECADRYARGERRG